MFAVVLKHCIDSLPVALNSILTGNMLKLNSNKKSQFPDQSFLNGKHFQFSYWFGINHIWVCWAAVCRICWDSSFFDTAQFVLKSLMHDLKLWSLKVTLNNGIQMLQCLMCINTFRLQIIDWQVRSHQRVFCCLQSVNTSLVRMISFCTLWVTRQIPTGFSKPS